MRTKRDLHQNFIDYMNLIVKHKNYVDLPNKFGKDKKIKWVSPSDKQRAVWWDKKIKKLGLINRAAVARAIHPKELKGLKPCQICGKSMSIFYVYPKRRILNALMTIAPDSKITVYDDISEIFDKLFSKLNSGVFEILTDAFNIPDSVKKDKIVYVDFIFKDRTNFLSPGAMSNAPDRLDGFHTYNNCCRSEQDTGRHRTNLARYTQDRRVYENWADGNWKVSNRLMGEFGKYTKELPCPNCNKVRKMTADHIGPISLGFTHRPKFNALCKGCNSQKNNRMTLKDVRTLVKDEQNGEAVISWHSRFIWDLLKNKVKTQADALKLTKLMRLNLHHVLSLFSLVSEAGHDKFLKQFLHPEFSFLDYKFTNFNPLDTSHKYEEFKSIDKNTKKNAKRYLRISFETLQEYKKIENRNTKKWDSKTVDESVDKLLSSKPNNRKLEVVLKLLALETAKKF